MTIKRVIYDPPINLNNGEFVSHEGLTYKVHSATGLFIVSSGKVIEIDSDVIEMSNYQLQLEIMKLRNKIKELQFYDARLGEPHDT